MLVSILLKPLLPISIPRIEMGPWALGLLGPGRLPPGGPKSGFCPVPPPPPPQGGDSGGSVGGSAPIGDGTLILILLASGYLLFRLRKYKLAEKN